MADQGLVRQAEQLVPNSLAAQGGDREGGHELLRRSCHDDSDGRVPVQKAADEFERLVGRDPAPDNEANPGACERSVRHATAKLNTWPAIGSNPGPPTPLRTFASYPA